MPTTAARPPLRPGRRRRAVALGAVFVGSSLVAVMSSPVHAEPSPSPSASPSGPPSASPSDPPSASPSDPPSSAPVPSATLGFGTDSSEVELGESAPPNPLIAANDGEAGICLLGLEVNAPEFTVRGFEPQEVAPRGSADAGEVTGVPRDTTEVTATLTYALAEEEADCTALDPAKQYTVATGTWTVSVTEPEPTPSPTPTLTPTPSPSPTEDDDAEESPSPPEDGGDDDRSDDGSRGSGAPTAPSPPRTPDGGVQDAPTSDVPTNDFPEPPSDEADLPEVSPGSEDLAELPTVTPGEDGDVDGTEVAAEHSDLGPNMAPAVLLAAFLLALLLAAPLAPVRRVRISGYQGKRRRR